MRSARLVTASLTPLLFSALTATAQSPPAAAATGVVLEHDAVGCIVAEQTSRLDACVSGNEISRVRLHFRAVSTPHWYFVDMAQEGDCHVGVLPGPLKSTKGVEYYIDAMDAAFAESRTEEYSPIVVEHESECGDRLVAALATERATPVGAPPGAPPVPAGFVAGTIVSATAGGLSTATLGLIGGGVAAASLGIVAATGGDDETVDPLDRDSDGDGYTSRQGDCDDSNAAVNPGAGPQGAGARFENPSTTCPDQTSNSPLAMPILLEVANNTCSDLTISSVSVTLTITRVEGDVLGYAVGQTTDFPNLPASPTTVHSGQTVTVRVEPVLQCSNWCGVGFMETSASITVQTSAGAFTLQTSAVNHTDYPLLVGP